MSDSPSEQALHWLSQDSHSIIKGWLNFVMTCKDRPAVRVSSHVSCLFYSLQSSTLVPLIYSQIYWLLLHLINLSLFDAADHWIKVIYKSAVIKCTLWNTHIDVSIFGHDPDQPMPVEQKKTMLASYYDILSLCYLGLYVFFLYSSKRLFFSYLECAC